MGKGMGGNGKRMGNGIGGEREGNGKGMGGPGRRVEGASAGGERAGAIAKGARMYIMVSVPIGAEHENWGEGGAGGVKETRQEETTHT